MLTYVVRRLAWTVPLLLVVSFVVFAIVTSFPGDPCDEKLGQRASTAAKKACRLELGLDEPFFERYQKFLGGALRLDFGRDFRTNEPVGKTIVEKPVPRLAAQRAAH